MKRIVVFLSLILAICFIHITAFAQEANTGLNLTISPSLLDLTASPGDTLKEKFRIRNDGDQAIQLSLVVDKLDPHSRNGQVVPMKPDPTDQSVSWISFPDQTGTTSANTYNSLPKEWLEIPFTITVPKTAAFGYYYAFRIGPASPTGQQKGTTTKLLGQIVLPVLLNVTSPNANAELKLLSFTAASFFNEYLPVSFQTTFANTGNIHIKPSGTIFIKLSDGASTSLDMNPESGIILPGGKRTFTTDWLDGFFVKQPVIEDGSPKVDKNGNVVTQLTINWNKLTSFRIGKYTATLLAVYDNGKTDVPLEASTTFWVFPYTMIGIGVGALVTLFFILRFFLKWYVAKEMKKYKNA